MNFASFVDKLVIPATIAAVSVAATIAFQQYSNKSNLTLSNVEQSAIVESVDTISDIDVIYNGKKIKKLFSTKFILENTGTKSIKKEHFVSPLILQFDENILGVMINNVEPKSLDGSISIHNNNNNVIFSIPLLNPSDKINFSVLSESENNIPRVSARIEGIADIFVRDAKYNNSNEKTRFITKLKHGAMFFSFAVVFLIGIGLFINFIKKYRYVKSAKSLSIFQGVTSNEQLHKKINSDLSFLTNDNRQYLYDSIIDLLSKPSNDNNGNDQEKSVHEAVQISLLIDNIIKKDSQGVAAGLFLIISAMLFYFFYF